MPTSHVARKRARTGWLALVLWLSLLAPSIALGNRALDGEPGVDLLILVDASGSMEVFDQDRLADDAVRYILDRLPQDTGSKVAVGCFGTGVVVVLEMSPLAEVPLEQLEGEVCDRTTHLRTDFVNVLEQAPELYDPETEPANRKVMLLLTDGHPASGTEAIRREDDEDRVVLETSVVDAIEALESEGIDVFVVGVGCMESGTECAWPEYKSPKFEDFWSKYDLTIIRQDGDLSKLDLPLDKVYSITALATPTSTATLFAIVTPTPTRTPSPSPTSTPAPTLTPIPSPTWTLLPSPTPTLTSSPSAIPLAVEQVTPTPTPMVKLPWEGLVPPREKLFRWLVPLGFLGLGLLVGWVLWNLGPRVKGEDIRKIGDLLRSEKDPAERRELFQRVNLWAIKLERILKEFEEIKEDIQKAAEQEWRDKGWRGLLDLWGMGELEIASLLQELLARFIIENHQESEALSTILELVNAGRFDKGKEFRSRFFKTLSETFGNASEEARHEGGRDFSYRIYDEYAQLLRYVANDDAERILATLLNIPDVLDKYGQDEDLALREDVYYLCYFLLALDPQRLSDGGEIRFFPEAEEALRQGSRYKDLPDLLDPLRGLPLATAKATRRLEEVQDSISRSSIAQFEKRLITILLRELEEVSVESASETST